MDWLIALVTVVPYAKVEWPAVFVQLFEASSVQKLSAYAIRVACPRASSFSVTFPTLSYLRCSVTKLFASLYCLIVVRLPRFVADVFPVWLGTPERAVDVYSS